MSQRKSADGNFISRLFFSWVGPLVWRGWRRKSLKQEDLYELPDQFHTSDLYCRFLRHWNVELERRQRGKKARLSWALLKCIWTMVLLSGALTFTEVSIFITQAVLVGSIAQHFSLPSPSAEERRGVYIRAGALAAVSFLLSIIHSHNLLTSYLMGVRVRIITTAAIYQKVLRLSLLTLARTTSGHVINLVSNDARRLDDCLCLIHTLWVAPIVMLVVGWLSWREVGPSCLAGIGFTVLTAVLQLVLARAHFKLRSKVVLVTDWRVKVMNEVIAGMKAIKVYAWEHAFQSLITRIRSKESRILTAAGMIRGSQLSLVFTSLTFSSFFTFVIFTSTGNDISVGKVFTVVTLFGVLVLLNVSWFTHGLEGMVEARVAIRRIQNLLELEELPSLTPNIAPPPTPPSGKQEKKKEPEFVTPTASHLPTDEDKTELRLPFVEFKDVCIWSEGYSSALLEEVAFLVNQANRLVVIIGPVGSGKSTILHTIMREHQAKKGHVLISGGVSLAGQEAWIFSGTVQENILCGRPLKPDWYHRVVHACGLEEDMASFPSGDLTLIGERGIGLSGGQRSRVSLARAVYRDTDIYLLDDPLSAVDTAVARHIFQHCIQGLLGNQLVLLVTHQLHYAQEADKILVLEEGQQRAFGSYSSLKNSGLDVGDLLRLMGEGPEEEGEGQANTHLQTRMTTRSPGPTHRDPCHPTYAPSTSLSALSQLSLYSELPDEEVYSEGVVMAEEDKASGGVTLMTYVHYLLAGGGYLLTLFTTVVFLMGEVSLIITDLWLAEWASAGSQNSSSCNASNSTPSALGQGVCRLDSRQRVAVYAGIAGVCAIILFTRLSLFFYIALRASRQLHNRMLAAVLRAPLRFFETNPLGRILNRFSRDVGFLDDQLPFRFGEYLKLGVHVLGTIIVPSIVTPWVAILSLTLILLFVGLRCYFLTGCREMKRLEAIARSPLYSHVSTTLQGLPVIRSCLMEEDMVKHYYRYQDENTKGWYLYHCFIRWFGLRIDVMTASFLTIVTFLSIWLAESSSAALVGLALTYVINLSANVQYTIRLSADVENLMISTERILAYTRLPPEASLHTLPPSTPPPPSWPESGQITLKRVSFRYGPRTPTVLKNISCAIQSGEKVGVVGRTGAGKSSLLSALFRLVEPQGMIKVDGICITDIGLHDLRKKISIIPQEPVLFSGTLRYNLDPFTDHQDWELWEVLEQVELGPLVKGLPGGLGCEMAEAGSNLSVGQRQLVCLARALLRKNKILVLDEATANVDLKTDAIIQYTLREKFARCTVLTIAHRLITVMDSNRIMVLDAGRLCEFDSPHRLLQRPQGLLSQLVDQSGSSEGARLRQAALDAHWRGHSRLEDLSPMSRSPSYHLAMEHFNCYEGTRV